MPHTSIENRKYTNHLAAESSPYLLSHAHNPVDWYPWGEEALNLARKLDWPIFLSVGYAACHWCHVMERESFENEEIAGYLNEHFVSIKVDREQRPDLDHIYMAFTTALTGSGGWPMSVFLTPDLKPFFAGTYFPPNEQYGRPGFMQLLTQIVQAHTENREGLKQSAESIYNQLSDRLNFEIAAAELRPEMIATGASQLMRSFDRQFGGFGLDRKFPHALELSLFLRHYHHSGEKAYLEAAEQALTAMAHGGIRDHLGGGFARYTVDREWLIPHFEKMLYDNSLLVPVYVEAYQLTDNPLYFEVVKHTLDFMLSEMTDDSGGFYSALDADSEGEEGKFYVWSREEIESILGEDALLFCEYYNVTDGGNFEGRNVLNISDYSQRVKERAGKADWDGWLESCRSRLLKVRSERVRPLTDDKILASWNGLALTALARGYQITGEDRYLEAARHNAEFVRETIYRDGALTHAYRQGVFSSGRFLEDYAYYTRGLLDLYESDPAPENSRWVDFAVKLADSAMALFQDDAGTFYMREPDQSDLIMRPKDETDGATPSAGSIMITALLKLNRITGDARYLDSAERGLKAISGLLSRQPGSMAAGLFALDYYLGDKLEFVVVGQSDDRDKMLDELYRRFLPNRVIAISSDGKTDMTLFEGRESKTGESLTYICRNSACLMPVGTHTELREQLDNTL